MNEYLFNSYGDISSNNLSFDKNGQMQDIVDEAVSKASEKTDEIVDGKINDLVNNAPEALDTLGEIAEKINEIETESLVTMTDVNNAINDALEEYTDTETLQANYLKSSDADASYQPKGEYLVEGDLEGYLKSADADASYQPKGEYLTVGDLDGYATEAYVNSKIDNLVNGAPEALDTLNEIAAQLRDDENAASALANTVASKADKDDVYDIETADSKFVDRATYDELNDKYNTLFNVVYSTATGDNATALNPQYVENTLSGGATSVVVERGELGDVTIPSTTKSLSVTAPMSDGATVTLTSPKAMTLVNTSVEPVDVNVSVPETESSSAPTISFGGKFDDLSVTNGSVGAKSGAAPLSVNNLYLVNEQDKNATVSGVVFGDGAIISFESEGKLGVANNNTSLDGNVPSATINAPESTVTLNKGQWNELTSNVGSDTLVVTQNAHINKLRVLKGNVIINDREVSNRVSEVLNETEYSVDVRRKSASNKSEFNAAMTGDPCVVTVTEDILDASRVGWGIFASGNYKLDLNGHTVRISDASFGIKTRNAVDLLIVDGVGTGKLICDKAYALWAGENTVITVDVPNTTEIVGTTHTLYCEGSGHPAINVRGGSFKLHVGEGETPDLDPNGNYRFLVNHYDSTYTREGNCFDITGGKFYNFNPKVSYSEPNGPVNLLPNGYTVEESVEDGVRVFTVVPDQNA